MSEEIRNQSDTFARFGKSFQEKTLQAVMSDHLFAEQMCDVLKPDHFELKYLQILAEKLFEHKQKFKTYPSTEMLEVMVSQDESAAPALIVQVKEYLSRIRGAPLNGDTGYIQSTSLEFVKKQVLKEAMVAAIDMMENGKYDAIQSVISDAMNKGVSHDLGHDYMEGFSSRGEKSIRKPIPTGWPVLDKAFNGGWERKTLVTFIAPTGAGKSMFLVNCGAAGIMNGLNVAYVTCEMADYKIGLRFDSYFSGIEINSISDKQVEVEQITRSKVKGRLVIKEFQTKTASPQTIRAYLQRLIATKGFCPDMLVVDYADLLRSSSKFGDKRFELECIYEELRALSQEFNMVVITADQTNRSGLDMEIVTIGQIGESYAKATVCDVIMTLSRRMEDKQTNGGRLFLAKSRLGTDGMVYPFIMNTATVKATLLEIGVDPIALMMENRENRNAAMSDKYRQLVKSIDVGSGSKQ
jgi:replicative DNA helicase